jgi:predicted amidohydrolase
MRVTVLQSPLAWEDPKANRDHFLAKIEAIQEGDLVVLPEMFSTGFSMKPQGVAHREAELDEYLAPFLELAMKKQLHIAGSLMVQNDEGDYFNRLVVLTPSGNMEVYNKRHLFAFAGENDAYTAGNQHLQMKIAGRQVAFFVCYDLRFPVWIRNQINNPYDVAVFTANWPAVRINAWNTLLKARAIENQCYVVAVNRVGKDNNDIEYNGMSQMIDAYGDVITYSRDKESVLSARLDMNTLDAFREKFPVLNDADDFTLR